MKKSRSKGEMLENLRAMLRDVLRLRREGTAYAKLERAHGYLDGYMRLMMEAGIADKHELLRLVADERQNLDGPATGLMDSEAQIVAA